MSTFWISRGKASSASRNSLLRVKQNKLLLPGDTIPGSDNQVSRKYWSEEDVGFLRENCGKVSPKELAEHFGVSYGAIISKTGKLGLTFKAESGEYWSEQEDAVLKSEFEWASKTTLMRLLPERSWPAILARGIKTHGLNRQTQDRHPINHRFFDDWSRESAYILGMVAADGHIFFHSGYRNKSSLQFELAAKDEDILLKIAEAMQFEGPVMKSSRNTRKLNISNTRIIGKLLEYGIPDRNKSMTMSWPQALPEKFYPDFVRGLFDGDGTVYYSGHTIRINFLGTADLLKGIKRAVPVFSHKIGVYYRGASPKGANVHCLKFTTHKALDIFEWMYQDSTIHSDRKYNKFINIINQWETLSGRKRR